MTQLTVQTQRHSTLTTRNFNKKSSHRSCTPAAPHVDLEGADHTAVSRIRGPLLQQAVHQAIRRAPRHLVSSLLDGARRAS